MYLSRSQSIPAFIWLLTVDKSYYLDDKDGNESHSTVKVPPYKPPRLLKCSVDI